MTVRINFNPNTAQYSVEQFTTSTRERHESSVRLLPPTVTTGWEVRSFHNNLVTAVFELLQLGIEEDDDIQSINIGFLSPEAPLIASLRSGLTSYTL